MYPRSFVVYKPKVACKALARLVINGFSKAYKILLDHGKKDKIERLEELKLRYLKRSKKPLQLVAFSQSGTSRTVADPSLILAAVIKVTA